MLSSNAVGIVVLLASVIGLQVSEEVIAETLSAVGTIISFGIMIWNQYHRPDVDKFFLRK